MNSNQYSISQTSAVSIKERFCNELYRLKSGLKTHDLAVLGEMSSFRHSPFTRDMKDENLLFYNKD